MACIPFTQAEIEVIMDNYYDKGAIGVAEMLPGRSRDTVKQWACKNGVKVSKEYRSAVARRANAIHKTNMSAETRKRIGDGHRKHHPFTCEKCNKPISYYKTLCWTCYLGKTQGSGNNNWRGGVSSLTKIVHTALADFWRTPVFIRDNHTCQRCGATGSLEAHHLRRYVVIRDAIIEANPQLSVNSVEGKFELAKLIIADHKLSDGITLCKKCHRDIHRKKRGELLETPEKDNQQPSQSNVRSIVDWKVQRLIGEDAQSNKPDTSAPHSDEEIGAMI